MRKVFDPGARWRNPLYHAFVFVVFHRLATSVRRPADAAGQPRAPAMGRRAPFRSGRAATRVEQSVEE
ncbi:MAG: hypothetical protein ACUVS4_01050 [Chloroflexaceae bacterium]